MKISRRDIAIIKRVLRDQGFANTEALLQVYLQSDDPWFAKKHHDLPTFESNIRQLEVNLQTGKTAAMRQVDRESDDLLESLQKEFGGNGDARAISLQQ